MDDTSAKRVEAIDVDEYHWWAAVAWATMGMFLFLVIKDVAFQGAFVACWFKILDTLRILILGYYTLIVVMFDKAVAVVLPVIADSVMGYFVLFYECWLLALAWPNPIFFVLLAWLFLHYIERYLRILVPRKPRAAKLLPRRRQSMKENIDDSMDEGAKSIPSWLGMEFWQGKRR